MKKPAKQTKPKMPDLIKRGMIAPCGMNCAVCSGYLREKDYCEGCRSENGNIPGYCEKCIIRNCEKWKAAKRPYCFNCDTYPCKRLKALDKRYRGRYGMGMLDNLERIRISGIREFVRDERKRWTCRHCGAVVSVHRKDCLFCSGEKSPDQLIFQDHSS